ncbi:hypothetical protein T05_16441 [Trichinella murrelli]|uniref:Uncharacterized protein n=3 Tax=Trichinella TaxID=6333 RepID=A0A0V0T7W7_9BILA|nr:hypothetical protein T05_16441 [Trichinella murrelli]
MEINFKCIMPKLMKGATPNELVKRCDGRSDVNHWMKSIRASETITQKHSDAYRSSWGVTITTRLALKQSLSTTTDTSYEFTKVLKSHCTRFQTTSITTQMDRVISLKPVSGQHGTRRLRTWEVPVNGQEGGGRRGGRSS